MPRKTLLPLAVVLLAGLFGLGTSGSEARTLNWARAGDAPTLDPHATDSSYAISLQQQIYEPLLLRDAQGKTLPALAESWGLTSDPLVWEFRLRRGVTFHDGTPFTAEDVVFSINRARQPDAGIAHLLGAIEQAAAVQSHVVRIRTKGPTPLLPASLTHLLIMSKAWAEKHTATKVARAGSLHRLHTFRNSNGTGPFALVSRETGTRTVMRRFDAYWGNAVSPVEITELVYHVLPNDTERVQALVSGQVDFVQDVPVNELPRLQAIKSLVVHTGPENRSVFIGLNLRSPEPNETGTAARNPLADLRVREALSIAISRQAIQRGVLLGQAIPTGTVAPPSINGYPRQLDRIPPTDVAKAKAMLVEAGYPNGFKMSFACPREGYSRSEAVCRAIGAQLAQIGIQAEFAIRSLAEHMELIRGNRGLPDAYLLGFSASSFDSEQVLSALFHSRVDGTGSLNATGYSNPEVDRLVGSLAGQLDFTARTQAMAQIWRTVQAQSIYVPLHIQTIAYAMKSDVNISVDIENLPELRSARLKTTIH